MKPVANGLKVLGFTLALFAWGCGSSGSVHFTSSGGSGTVNVSLTDAAPCGYDQVNVTVSTVRIHQSTDADGNDAGWSDIILSAPKKINLTSLMNGVLADLGHTALPAGKYTQLRLLLLPNTPSQPLNNSVVPTGGPETPLATPSAVQSGIKLIHEFDVAEGTLVDLVLDFDACHSIVKKGNGGFALKPVITVIPMEVSGGIAGTVDSTLLPASPMVFAEQGGVIVKATVPDSTGSFILSPLLQSDTAGDYDVVISADEHATAMIQSVPVTAHAVTDISDTVNPIVLDGSTMQTISGTVLPVSAEASIRALQTFTSGSTPTMTVGFVSANLTDGTYALSLPIGAPSLGSYGPLPIPLAPDASIAGIYQVEASATGYITQSPTVDISGGDVTQDFTLTP
jgi:Domain of unknown function (DUF4382)